MQVCCHGDVLYKKKFTLLAFHPVQAYPAQKIECELFITGVAVVAYSSLGVGNLLLDKTINRIAEKHGKTAVQVIQQEKQGVYISPSSSVLRTPTACKSLILPCTKYEMII